MFLVFVIAVQAGCVGLALAADSVVLLAAAHVGAIAASGLAIHRSAMPDAGDGPASDGGGDELNPEAARRLIAGAVSLVCFLLMAAFLFALTGSFELAQMQTVLRNSYRPDHADMIVGAGSRLGIVAVVLLFAATGIQFSLPPFQVTLSNVFRDCPAGVSGFIAVANRFQAAVVIWKVAVVALVGFEPTVQIVALICSLAAATIGTAAVCRSESLRDLAAGFWTVSAAMIFLALAAGAASPLRPIGRTEWRLPDGVETAGFAVLTSGVALLLLLATEWCASLPERRLDFPEDVAGLGQQRPHLALALAAGLLTFCAIPPLPGFWTFAFLAASVFVPGLSDRSDAPNPALLLGLAVTGISLLICSTRLISWLSLMFQHEPLRRFQSSAPGFAPLIPVALAVALLWSGIFPRLALSWLHDVLR